MTKSLSGSGSNANAAETKQILLKEIRAKWGKFSEDDLSSLKDKDDLVIQRRREVRSGEIAGEARRRRPMNGRQF